MDLDDAELEAQLRDTFQRAAAPVRGDGVDRQAVRDEADRRRTARTRARWTGGLALAAAAVAATVALVVMVGQDDDRVETEGVATQPTTTTVAPDASDPSEDDAPATTTTVPETTTSTAPSTTTTVPTTTTTVPANPQPELPPELDGITHGGEAWGLYLTVVPSGQYDAPALATADQAARAVGYGPTGGGEIACDRGAAEALGVDPTSLAAVVYFETEAAADQAREAFEAQSYLPLGVAHVVTYCLD